MTANLITEKRFSFKLPEGKKKERIDVFLANSVENATRTRIQKLIEAGYVTVNGKVIKSNYKVAPFDEILVAIPVSPRPEKAEPEDIPLDIVYEDDHLIVVNKPAGMAAHPSLGNYTGTLVHALLHHTRHLSTVNSEFRPGIVHRIDKDTSGLLIVAKDDISHSRLAHQFASHTIKRDYIAVAWGIPEKRSGEINTLITRSKKDRKKFTVSDTEGKQAITFYEVIEEFEFASLLRLRLKTGRTHQIRVHLSSIGHPIFGDEAYGGRVILFGSTLPKMKSRVSNLLEIIKRQALHARSLGFIHPVTKEEMMFTSEPPEDMATLIEKLRVTNDR